MQRFSVLVAFVCFVVCRLAVSKFVETDNDGKRIRKSVMDIKPSGVKNVSPLQAGKMEERLSKSLRGAMKTESNYYYSHTASNPINYNGGPVMSSLTVYLIWYGTWSSSDQSLIRQFLQGFSGSPYMNINAQYSSSNPTAYVSSTFTVSPQEYSNPSNAYVSDYDIYNLVVSATNANMPLDSNGLYFVLTAAGVGETSGFCSQYCGWHTYNYIRNKEIKYSFVGNPLGDVTYGGSTYSCINGCAVNYQRSDGTIAPNSPNNSPGVDAMLSVVVHELSETVTDPVFNGYTDVYGSENGDKCAWNWGSYSCTSDYCYNMNLSGKKYLIQQNWRLAPTQSCALQAGTTALSTATPSQNPTTNPTTSTPSKKPTTNPTTATPSKNPTTKPTTATPSTKPSVKPSITPSTKPTVQPSIVPSKNPSKAPISPTRVPSRAPSTKPV